MNKVRFGGFFDIVVLFDKTRKMKGYVVVLLCVGTLGADAATLGVAGAPLCGYGMYKYNGECVSLTAPVEKCPQINGLDSYIVPLDASTFLYREIYGTNECLGTHVLYEYDTSVLAAFRGGGSLRSFGPPLCGYGQYRLNNTCYDVTDDDAVGSCPDGFHRSVSDTATFMDLYSQGFVCQGTHVLYEYSERLQPIYNGTLLSVGAPLETAADMRQTRCSKNPDEYYQIAVAEEDTFAFPDLGACQTTSVKYAVKSDCKDIDVTDANSLRANSVCGVLCDSGVYTNAGTCATGYCEYDGARRRLFYSSNGVTRAISAYASQVTTPSINISGGPITGVCYVNLVPNDTGKQTIRVKNNDTLYYAID